jgi:vacuolar-type H+-ATPase catalytic subunit A/Vma1
MTLDKLYIDEAKRIRKVYLTNLANIVNKEDEIEMYFQLIENIKNEVNNSQNAIDEQFFISKLMEINDNIEKIKSFIIPHYEKIKELDGSQKTLYNNIKDKYPSITDEEVQDQIMPHIIPIDEKFMKDNKELYNKILLREK